MSSNEFPTSPAGSEAQIYLSQNKISDLFKYFATELILNKPDDPLQFLLNLIHGPVSQVDYSYSPQLVKDLLRESRKNATGVSKRMSVTSHAFSDLVESMRKIAGELEPSSAMHKIVEETCTLLGCERATLFTVDGDTNELILHVANSSEKIRLPVGQGIAGSVAETGKALLIQDAYADARFDPSVDKRTGYKTKNILCAPLKDFNTDEVYAVIQAINKERGFTLRDTYMIETLGTQAVITLQNSIIYEIAAAEQNRTNALVELLTALKSGWNISSLIFSIKQRTLEIVNASRSTFFLVDQHARKIWSLQGEVNIILPLDQGIVGACAMSGEIENIDAPYEDPRFDRTFDEKSGFVTKSILCVPMKSPADEAVIAVLQVINKNTAPAFDARDEHLLEIILSIAAPMIYAKNAFRFLGHQDPQKYNERMVSESSMDLTVEMSQHVEGIEEGDEDDDEDEN